MKYKATSAVIGRMPRKSPNEFKTAFVKLFDVAEPLKTEKFPLEELTFSNTERVEFRGVDCDYYTEGNDLVFTNIKGVTIKQDKHVLSVSFEK
ncbi:MAG TPA: hypothetical protein VK158_00750 [Acidobacteriota bacterium]|nr:hypothetical protein [Acidobacteriota bacterium]